MPAGFVTAITGIAGTLGASAAAADVIGAVLGDAAFGALAGGTVSSLTGGSFGKGAVGGAITGGALGFAPEIGATLGIGTGAADVLAGAAGGLTAAGIQGGDLGKGALFGGIEGGVAGLLSGPKGNVTQPSGSAPGGGASAGAGAGAAAPAVAGSSGLPVDLIASPGASQIGTPGFVGSLENAGAGAGIGTGGIEGITVSGERGLGSGLNLAGQVFGPAAGTGAALATSGALGGDQPHNFPGDNVAAPKTQVSALAGGAPVAPGGKTTSVGRFAQDPSLKNFGNILTSNPGTVLGLGTLGYEVASKPSLPDTSALVGDLKTQADAFAGQGKELMSFINNGTLPPGAQALVTNATNSAKASLKSRFASLGLTGSTAEATALAQVDQQAAGQVFEIANNLLQSGIKESQLSADLYKSILGETNAENQQLSTAISTFAASLAGGGARGLNINVGGTGT